MSEIIVRFPDFPDVPALSTEHEGEGCWLADLSGWWDGVESRTESDPRPDADGDYDQEPVYSEARYPIVTGRVRFSDEAEMFAARKPFARLAAHRGPFTLEVQSPDGVQQAKVIRNGRLVWDMSNPMRFEFELPLKAADPRKYGPLKVASTGLPMPGGGVESPVTSPFSQAMTPFGDSFPSGDTFEDTFPGSVISSGSTGRVTLVNLGTTDTIPLLRVSGGGLSQGVELTRIETAEKLRLEWPLLTTDTVTFSPGDGQVWLNDQAPIAGYLTLAQWWTLGPGETATIQFEGLGDVSGNPVLTVEYRDADA